MNSTQQTARVGLFFLLGLALVWVAFETLSGNNHFFRKQGYHLVASFADLKEVKVGDEVRMAGSSATWGRASTGRWARCPQP